MKTPYQALVSYVNAITYDKLPGNAVHEVKRRLIDSIGCALGGYFGEPCKIARSIASSFQTQKGATLIGTRTKTVTDLATFANGSMIRYLDYNDTYLSKEPCHPSDNFSAILAIGEAAHAGGKEIIAATVTAYEVICRLCDAAGIRKRGWDHVTYGNFSSCLAACKLLKLSTDRMLHALAIAVTPNIALRQTRIGELSMWKGCAFANAARNGVFAALLAQDGMTGPSEILEGKHGFWRQVSGEFQLEIIGNIKRPKIMETAIKYFPAEYHSQAAIEAALEVRKKVANVHNIESIEVDTFDTAVEIIGSEREKWKPQSRETADHSMPYCVAAALVDGDVWLNSFTEDKIRDRDIMSLIEKIIVKPDPTLSKQYPAATPSVIRVRMKSGEALEKQVTYPLGHPQRPLDDKQVEEKFRKLTAEMLTRKEMEKILEAIWHLERVDDVGEILELLAIQSIG